MRQIIYIEYLNKKYPLIITDSKDLEDNEEGAIHIKCEAAGLDQGYLLEDLGGLIELVPDLIAERKKINKQRLNSIIRFRASEEDKKHILENVEKYGYKNMSDFIKNVAINPEKILNR